MVFTEAELVRWNLLVNISVLMEAFEEESLKNLDRMGKRLMGLFDVTLVGGLPGF